MQFQSPLIPFPGCVQQRGVWWRRWRGPHCSQTDCSRHSPSRPTSSTPAARAASHPPNPLTSRGQGLCWRVWWWCVMCPMSVYLRSCVPVCLCRVPSVYPEICGQSSAAVTILLCCIQARGGRVPRRARKGLAPCRATAEPPRRAGGSSRAAAAGPSGATTYLQSEPSPTQRILNTTHSKFQILPIALIW